MGHYDTSNCDICSEEMLEHYWDNYEFCSKCKSKYYKITNNNLYGANMTDDEFKSVAVLLKLVS